MAQTRRMLVLRAVVEDYIRNQEPVGSSALARRHDLGVSSATIRNDMAVLEAEGYLIQPHTSAGRIPTEKGYRYFVDRLATVVPLSQAQRQGIGTFLAGSVNLQDTLRRAARLLSQITGQIAVVASPSLSKSTMRHVELVPIATNTMLAVVITDTGRVAQHVLAAPAMPTPDDIRRVAQIVNRICTGHGLRDCAGRIRALRSDDLGSWDTDLTVRLAAALDAMADEEHASDLYMAGTARLAHRETSQDLGPLFDALEEQVVIMRLMTDLSEHLDDRGIGIAIGSETKTPGLMHASVVTSGYGQDTTNHGHKADDDYAHSDARHMADAAETSFGLSEPSSSSAVTPVAFVGSIGPTHMDYATTMAAVSTVASYLTEFLGNERPQ
ncbi:heat-inducible transcriptional repressor HrcA [Bifidobacterium gallicum]|uniref:Heat-inducible transcription repressor HrcA n=1 Tax=Bifidobacterium gallicum DSM 20093 = LMG 11596 TaxID=561180 RepID=D1NTN1_9BIFI|nr:heat-inducible transcriptional repressor HrcA [Bifidobacterium gallicum]EFA23085.1 heat-inducible transcription repressor HrcA [Bifidobacterium gallicum DSM 20093 = LMG 11596]KFI58770.1 HrcA family transcriptional regulator [Bifidobacterium gallicum DSM 20093 = LMG 11596]